LGIRGGGGMGWRGVEGALKARPWCALRMLCCAMLCHAVLCCARLWDLGQDGHVVAEEARSVEPR
jgi:hypothetical protein